MLSVVCFKWFRPESRHNHLFVYGPEYVNNLRNMLGRHLSIPHELVCVTDDPEGIDERVGIVELPEDIRGFPYLCQKLFVFHPKGREMFGARVLLTDLDCVVCNSIDHLVTRTEPFVAWEQKPGNMGRFNTSMVLFDGGAFGDIWETYDPDNSHEILERHGFGPWDQDWVSYVLGNEGATWPREGGDVVSYTPNRFRPVPSFASIVYFPGRASPGMAECRRMSPWITEYWR